MGDAKMEFLDALSCRGIRWESDDEIPARVFTHSKWILSLIPESTPIAYVGLDWEDDISFRFPRLCECEGDREDSCGRGYHFRPYIDVYPANREGLPPKVYCNLCDPRHSGRTIDLVFNGEEDDDDELKKFIPRLCRYIETRGAVGADIFPREEREESEWE